MDALREFRLWRIFLLAAIVSELPSLYSQNANPYSNAARLNMGSCARAHHQNKRTSFWMSFCFGDPYGNLPRPTRLPTRKRRVNVANPAFAMQTLFRFRARNRQKRKAGLNVLLSFLVTRTGIEPMFPA